ncbi:MAG: hypothetical protein RLO50_07140 [Azospirillaceae bacterium]
MFVRCVAFSAMALVSGAALAQDFSLTPTFGEAELDTGFMPDPQAVTLAAGGDIDAASSIGEGCVGFIADAPDFRLYYSAGSTYDLAFFVQSDADTTLVINAPDGSWHCNDDADGLNPAVGFDQPMSGQYDIWVGTYAEGAFPAAVLAVTELIDVTDAGETPTPPELPETTEEDTEEGDDAAEESEAPAEPDSGSGSGGK